jgi:hypothetical protein
MQRESLNAVMRLATNFCYSESLTKEFQDVKMVMVETSKRISAGNPTDYMPLFKPIPSNFAKELGDITDLRDTYLRKWVKEHKGTPGPAAPRGFLDKMLMEIGAVGLTDGGIIIILWDITAGGIDATATSAEWLIYLLIEHPEVQKKAQAELQVACGDGRLPTYEDARTAFRTDINMISLLYFSCNCSYTRRSQVPYGTGNRRVQVPYVI